VQLLVNEIFHSIQGESTHSGFPCTFIRLSGCNLRCSWCDTKYAYNEGKAYDVAEIIDRIADLECNLVEVTGGEPLIQETTPHLLRTLLDIGYTVLLETNGSIDIGLADPRCHRIVDIKCPSSRMADKNYLGNLEKFTALDELKFVISNSEDYVFAKKILATALPHLETVHATVNFSPLFGIMDPRTLAEWILRDRLPVRFNMQLHKLLWDPCTRGV